MVQFKDDFENDLYVGILSMQEEEYSEFLNSQGIPHTHQKHDLIETGTLIKLDAELLRPLIEKAESFDPLEKKYVKWREFYKHALRERSQNYAMDMSKECGEQIERMHRRGIRAEFFQHFKSLGEFHEAILQYHNIEQIDEDEDDFDLADQFNDVKFALLND